MSNQILSLQDLATKARVFADDLRRHARNESASGHLSPTDSAILIRIEAFLREEVGSLAPPQ
jgi:hypothetical protein